MLSTLVGGACATETVFRDAPVVWEVADDQPIAEPEENEYNKFVHYPQILAVDPVQRTLSIPTSSRARDINALDEVPDSTWFENRMGRYDLSPDDVARGPGGGPPKLPLTITKGKSFGSNPGFFAKDADGRRFLIKFDLHPEMETGNAAIVSRLLWAVGYHAPSENVFWFSPDDVVIDPKATMDTDLESDLPFTRAMLEQVLSRSVSHNDGKHRSLASELLPGSPKGGWSDRGVRKDDANDIIPHEHRRSLRALQVFGAWLEHSDINIRNTLDVYVEEDGRKFLRHYLVDFGETLGAHGIDHAWIGYAHLFDYEYQFLSLVSFGMWVRPWEDKPQRPFQSVGSYIPDIDPRSWREKKPYYPFRERTDADSFWAAKIIMRLSRDHIEAAVKAAKLSDPAAAGYLVETILARGRSIGRSYMTEVTALDRFGVTPDGLCMTDLAVHHRLAQGGIVERIVDGEVAERERIAPDGELCLAGPKEDAYVRYTLRTVRGSKELEPIEVHVRGGAEPRVVGVVRDF
ncbi:MAG: hypothetical protein HOW73_34080 [Polyangiaceae bacterium]|nr:hypothetical protein [Polyangiaceae bacterium]